MGHTRYSPRHNLHMSLELQVSESAEGMHMGHLAMVPRRMSNALGGSEMGRTPAFGGNSKNPELSPYPEYPCAGPAMPPAAAVAPPDEAKNGAF